jgi:hypothetical protein
MGLNICPAPTVDKAADVAAVDNVDDDDDDDAMRSLLALGALLVTLLVAPGALSHDGHGATPAHVHSGGFALDVGAAVAAIVVGGALLAAARRRA